LRRDEFQSNFGLKSPSGFLRLLAIFYVVLIGGLIILGVLFYRNKQAFNNGSAWVTHTRTVIGRTDTILLLSQNLQWESRNYTLTGDSNSYREYFSLRDSIQTSVRILEQLVGDNKFQQTNTTKLGQQIIRLIQFTDNSLQLRIVPGDLMSRFIANVKQHILLHNAINRQIQLIKTEESRLLALRRADVYKTIDSNYRIFLSACILFFILLAGTFVFIFYHFKKRQQAEEKLVESEHRFQTLINGTTDLAIFMIDDKGCILDWYAGAHNIKGYRKEEVIGKSISIFYTPESIAAGEPGHNLQITADQGSFQTEGWRLRKDGSRFWADVLITAVYDKDGKVQGFTKVTRDFSLRKKMQDEIKYMLQTEMELSRMKSDFVSMASHEFRTPLSTIASSISLIEKYRTTETQDNRDKHIKRIKFAVSEMVVMLEEFLSLEKIEQGKVRVRNENFDLKDLSEQTIARFNTTLKAEQFISYTHSGKEEVCFDATFISHILNNFLSNAIKYSPEGTHIILESFVNQNTITIRITDHGFGISPEDQKHLFERFFRASNTGNIKGTGLGLHIVKRYTDLLGGTIEVNSEIDKGSVFTVTMPFEN
jgi:PAS domain S-box-containing protein